MYNFCDSTYLESIILTFLANLWCFQKIVFSLCDCDHSATVTQLTSYLNINPSILPNSTPARAFFAPSVRAELRISDFSLLKYFLWVDGSLSRFPHHISSNSQLISMTQVLNPENEILIRSNVRVVSVDALYCRSWCFIVNREDQSCNAVTACCYSSASRWCWRWLYWITVMCLVLI